MKPTAEMVERAEALLHWNHDELCEATIKHVHEIGGADVRYMTPGAECECKHRHIVQALADEHERAMQQPAIREAEIRGATWALEHAESAPPSKLMPGAQRNYEAEAARVVDAKRDKG